MKSSSALNRRRFFQTTLMGSAALAAASLPAVSHAALTKEPRDPFDGLKIGMTSYSLHKFTLDQAIAMTRQTGVKYISLKDVHLALKSTPEERRQARAKVEAAGLTLAGGGVIYMKNNEAEVRGYFEYAKDAGMPTIICSPDPEALDLVEKLAKEYDVRVAIHNHGPTDKKYPSPRDVLRLIDKRDSHMGICMDVGHTVRIGEDPVAVIRDCAARLYDFHMKDVTAPTPQGHAIEVGRGIIDIVAVLKTLLQVRYAYCVNLEYELHDDNPMPGVIESYAYMRGILAAV